MYILIYIYNHIYVYVYKYIFVVTPTVMAWIRTWYISSHCFHSSMATKVEFKTWLQLDHWKRVPYTRQVLVPSKSTIKPSSR